MACAMSSSIAKTSGELAVVVVGPEPEAVVGAHQLRRDAHAVACAAQRAVDEIRGAERLADRAEVLVLAFELKGRRAPDDAQARDTRQRRGNFVGHAVGQELLLLVPGEIRERQNGDRQATGLRRREHRLRRVRRAGHSLIDKTRDDDEGTGRQRPIEPGCGGRHRIVVNGRQLVDPGEDERDRETHEQQNEHERPGPFGEPQHRREIADELDDYPRDDGVDRGDTIDVASFQVGQETPRSAHSRSLHEIAAQDSGINR